MRQSDSQAWECRKREQETPSHSRSSSNFSSKLMCRKREQDRNPSTQQCIEYCGAGQGGQGGPYATGRGGDYPRAPVLPLPGPGSYLGDRGCHTHKHTPSVFFVCPNPEDGVGEGPRKALEKEIQGCGEDSLGR